MRFTFITGTPRSVRGGSGTYVGIEVLRQALAGLGHAVRIQAPGTSRAPLGLTAWRLGFNLSLAARYRAGSDLTVGFDMDGFLIPVSRTGPYLVSIKGVLAEELTFERGAVRSLLALQAWCERRNVRRSPLVVTTSRYAADRIANHYAVQPDRIRQVPELIDLDRWRAELATISPDPTGVPVLLAVAHMYPRKSLDVLLHALARLPWRWRHVRLHIVGVGPEFERLQALTQHLGLGERVSFLGHLPRARLVAEYRQCTLFCLPSRQEGFGIVYLEAMAAGKAVVACRAAAVQELVDHGVTGLLVAPGDAAALGIALTTLLDDPDCRSAFGAAGQERASAYAAPTVARHFLAVAEEARDLAAPSG
ncbi:MAG: glycosyltransferase family 4 protein [Chloroflexota bacterium]